MNNIEIYVHDDSNEYEYDFGVQKGYWDNVYVRKNNKVFRLNIITLERLVQECNYSMQWAGCYISDPNIVIVKSATKNDIVKTLLKQNEIGYFEQLVQCDVVGEIICLQSEKIWMRTNKNSFKVDELKKIYT